MYFRSFASVLCAIVLLLSAAGCAASSPKYVTGYHYGPQPAIATVFSDARKPAVNVMASAIGIRAGDRAMPISLEVRMRFQNVGAVAATFDPQSLELAMGTLEPFGPPRVLPPAPLHLSPGQTAHVTAHFPLPPLTQDLSMMGLDTVRLRWQVQIAGQSIEQSVRFFRVSPEALGQ